ncbi:sigma-54-dependent Fis family transcriptional regulator [Prevotella stercorea]|uniref:sigma-54-dependent transcriptional regulator n=1 Tax=Leyella stercorea TaxID=363265 RepID=UPI001F2E4AE6|nr:sigma-54 dependent transcriptional regulator [Leyella stercorea]MCF2578262.1 sigma-54-dependent Fis family transcriptional regulator [Leyella stercorea]
MTRILIVEDDIAFGTMMQTWLKKKGFDVDKATSVGAAVRLIEEKPAYNLVLSDLRLPDRDGLELLAWLHKHSMSIPFIVMTNYAEVQNAVLAMKSGAADYIAKPIQPDILLSKIKDALQNAEKTTTNHTTSTPQHHNTNNTTTTPQPHNPSPRHIEGKSDASRQLYSYVSLVAPTPMSVLILGASGTGKEYVARRIHEQSQRAGKPFVALDCGAIPRDVAASEFFGHKKGAFTGADADKRGAFEAANGGTLFLDEVGNLSYEVQVQLLRALQERRVCPLGSTEERPIDIRLVAATNENLEQAVAEGRFREDLYHRLSEFTIYMPQLSERGTDLYLFADLFVRLANEELSRHVEGFDARAAEKLASYSWPGNLRELNNVVKRAVLMARGAFITQDELSAAMGPVRQEPITALHDADAERQRILDAVKLCGGNKSKAARMLGIDRKTLYNKLG